MVDNDRRAGLSTVLSWYRQRLTATRWGNQQPAVVPAEYAGWVLAAAGEPADADGVRPLGAIRDALLATFTAAGSHTDDAARQAACGVWGLTEWPAYNVDRPLARRLPVQRRRSGPDGRVRELTPARVRQLSRAFLDVLDAKDHRRPGRRACVASPVPNPLDAPWFLEATSGWPPARVRDVIADGLDWAHEFVSRTGTAGAAGALLDDLARFTFHINHNDPAQRRRPIVRSHIRALVAIGLWEALHRHRRPSVTARPDMPIAGFGATTPPHGFTPVASVIAELISGDRSAAVLSASCDEGRRLADTDRESAAVVVDLLLTCYSDADPDNAAKILQTAVRHRVDAEDWTAVTLAERCYRDHPLSYRTVDALQLAVRVATAHLRWTVARRLLAKMDASLRFGIQVPPGRDVRVETVEYTLWSIHQRTATERRLLQAIGPTDGLAKAREALQHGSLAMGYLAHAFTLNDKLAPGDVSELWLHPLLVRQAELEIVLAERLTSGDRRARLRRADAILDEARALCRRYPQLDATSAAMVKAELSLALGTGDDRHAADLLTVLHQRHRWPLHRSVPQVSDIAAGRPSPLVGPILRARIAELAAQQTQPGWRPAADPANRNRRATHR